jgi:hypothetical protein
MQFGAAVRLHHHETEEVQDWLLPDRIMLQKVRSSCRVADTLSHKYPLV